MRRRRRAATGADRRGEIQPPACSGLLREFVAGAEEERARLREAVRRVIAVVDEALG